jgi:hypothetical protein
LAGKPGLAVWVDPAGFLDIRFDPILKEIVFHERTPFQSKRTSGVEKPFSHHPALPVVKA